MTTCRRMMWNTCSSRMLKRRFGLHERVSGKSMVKRGKNQISKGESENDLVFYHITLYIEIF